MKVTAVKICLMPGAGPLKAFASITFNDSFVVHDLRIIKTAEKTFVAMPSKKRTDGDRGAQGVYQDIAHPINKETRDEIHKAVLAEYEQTVESMNLK